MNGFRHGLGVALLCATCMPSGAVAVPAARATAGTQSHLPCSSGAVAVRTHGAVAFTLATGAYSMDFDGGSLRIGRGKAFGGLRLRLLPGDTNLDLLRHVTRRTITLSAAGDVVTLSAATPWGTAAISFRAYAACPGLLRWTVTLAARATGAVPDASGTELAYTDAWGRPAKPAVTVYTGAAPSATALSYLFDPDIASTLFYLADLTALNPFFRATNTAAVGGSFRDPRGGPGSTVGVAANGFGVELPQGSLSALGPESRPIVVLDSYLLITPGRPRDEAVTALRFLDDLGAIYLYIQHPAAHVPDWRTLGGYTARDLGGSDVIVPLAGHTYLKAYVSDTRRAPELITQLNVLSGAIAYEQTFTGSTSVARLRSMLMSGISTFYAPEYHSVVNNLPIPTGAGGRSESWYYIGDLVYLARAAAADNGARAIFLRSIGSAIALAHHVQYVFPRSITYQGWQGSGAPQADVAGGYAYLMLQAYDLTHDRRYVGEAEASIEHLAGYGFRLAYETHMTALAATAAARLYRLTGNAHYLELSMSPLANLFASAWLWDCGYGTCASGYHTFFGLSPLPWSGYIAMMEQAEAWRALREYALLLGTDGPASVRMLVAEFYRYSLSTLAYTLPPLLPKRVASGAPAEYSFVPRNRLDLYIPLEDLHDGSQPSGQIGQEIYGAGGPLTLAGLSYSRLTAGLWLVSPYPVSVSMVGHTFRLAVAGTGQFSITLRLEGSGRGLVLSILDRGNHQIHMTACGHARCFQAAGGATYTLALP